jgi:hypothetical protein
MKKKLLEQELISAACRKSKDSKFPLGGTISNCCDVLCDYLANSQINLEKNHLVIRHAEYRIKRVPLAYSDKKLEGLELKASQTPDLLIIDAKYDLNKYFSLLPPKTNLSIRAELYPAKIDFECSLYGMISIYSKSIIK